ncbi:PQQ-binding-like beta-propeller repeat protein [Natrinema sp. CBA1119]|uniref:outer membrane protein assembly factor BamB family protein n=1 Tax=Natrinema sp. CBA1119 TaxID=1608465 RepID=UPI00159B87D3|nr:PQQ-binding-like beta-propeller repeat protein [Natrinema sp. CBA1119]
MTTDDGILRRETLKLLGALGVGTTAGVSTAAGAVTSDYPVVVGEWRQIGRATTQSSYNTDTDGPIDTPTTLDWWETLGGNSVTAPAIANDTVYVADGTQVVALDISNGRVTWKYDEGEVFTDRPIVVEGISSSSIAIQGIATLSRNFTFSTLPTGVRSGWQMSPVVLAFPLPMGRCVMSLMAQPSAR